VMPQSHAPAVIPSRKAQKSARSMNVPIRFRRLGRLTPANPGLRLGCCFLGHTLGIALRLIPVPCRPVLGTPKFPTALKPVAVLVLPTGAAQDDAHAADVEQDGVGPDLAVRLAAMRAFAVSGMHASPDQSRQIDRFHFRKPS
jgi:hypothetical protein